MELGEKKGLATREPGKYYEKLSMPEVKLLCGREMRLMALDVGLDDHGIHLQCPLKRRRSMERESDLLLRKISLSETKDELNVTVLKLVAKI